MHNLLHALRDSGAPDAAAKALRSTIVIEPWHLEGVVEEILLRATTLRDVGGQVLRNALRARRAAGAGAASPSQEVAEAAPPRPPLFVPRSTGR